MQTIVDVIFVPVVNLSFNVLLFTLYLVTTPTNFYAPEKIVACDL